MSHEGLCQPLVFRAELQVVTETGKSRRTIQQPLTAPPGSEMPQTLHSSPLYSPGSNLEFLLSPVTSGTCYLTSLSLGFCIRNIHAMGFL